VRGDVKPRSFRSPADVARELGGVVAHGRALADLFVRGRLTAHDRELITVAVSRVNGCAGCTFVHERWALRAGVSDEDLRTLELGELQRLGPRQRTLVVYAAARAEMRFAEPAPAEVLDIARATLAPAEIAAAEALARAMTFANLAVSTAEALSARVRRSAPGGAGGT